MNERKAVRSETKPADRWYVFTRLAWLLTAGLVLLFLIPEMQATLATAKHLCSSVSSCDAFQLTLKERRALGQVGITAGAHAAYGVALVAVTVVACYSLAAAMMWQRSRDRMLVIAAFSLVLGCGPLLQNLQFGGGVWARPTELLGLLGPISVGIFLYSFPAGSFVPRWTALFALGYAILQLVPSSALPNAVGALLWFTVGVSIIAIQIYRFRRVSNAVQRQQTKLVLLGFGYLACLFIVATLLFSFDAGGESQAPAILFLQTAFGLAPVPIIITVGLAMLRYRLWDVDLLINRTLVYITLTISLVLLYLGTVIGLQAIFRAITGQQSDIAIALSTLIIAALFNPLRRRIHSLIARTFYRGRYDAAQVLAAFGATCRDETDLETLRADLVRVVRDTVQPGHVSLWLREGEG